MINFIKHRYSYLFFSALMLIGVYFFVFTKGFVFSIDFLGGGLVEFVAKEAIVKKAEVLIKDKNLTFQRTSAGFIIKGTKLNKKAADSLTKQITNKTGAKQKRFEVVGASLSSENSKKIVFASLLSVAIILLYIAYIFKGMRFAVAAVVALLHDTLLLLGSWAFFGHFWGAEFDILFITSLLTIMSFSVHDTIVIFDKVKEESKQGGGSLEDVINRALNLTMMRSINNSLTIIIMLTSLIILGGDSIRWFAVSLLVGTVLGTYSSPFVAVPVYYLLSKRTQKGR